MKRLLLFSLIFVFIFSAYTDAMAFSARRPKNPPTRNPQPAPGQTRTNSYDAESSGQSSSGSSSSSSSHSSGSSGRSGGSNASAPTTKATTAVVPSVVVETQKKKKPFNWRKWGIPLFCLVCILFVGVWYATRFVNLNKFLRR